MSLAMENSQFQSLSIESFSYRWLINLKPCAAEDVVEGTTTADFFDAFDDASFIELDLRSMAASSKRFLRDAQDLNFDFSISQSPLALVHADELFSNGLIMPLFIDPSKKKQNSHNDDDDEASCTVPTSPPRDSDASSDAVFTRRRRRRRLSKAIFQKYLFFLRPLFRRLSGRGSSSRVEVERFDSNGMELKNWNSSSSQAAAATASPRRSSSSYCSINDDWRMSCDSESSIYEAVLHCKRSIGK